MQCVYHTVVPHVFWTRQRFTGVRWYLTRYNTHWSPNVEQWKSISLCGRAGNLVRDSFSCLSRILCCWFVTGRVGDGCVWSPLREVELQTYPMAHCVCVCVWVGALHQNLLCTTLVPIRCNQDPILSDLCLTSFRFVLEFVTASPEHQLHTPPWSASEQNGRLQVFTLTSMGESKTVMTELPDICWILISIHGSASWSFLSISIKRGQSDIPSYCGGFFDSNLAALL